jgi:helix-turn-helix protein
MDLFTSTLAPQARLLLGIISGFKPENGCYLRQTQLAARTGLSIRSVQRWLTVLERAGLIVKSRGGHTDARNTYHLADPNTTNTTPASPSNTTLASPSNTTLASPSNTTGALIDEVSNSTKGEAPEVLPFPSRPETIETSHAANRSHELSPHGLAATWLFYRKGTGRERPQEAAEVFEGLIGDGIGAETVDAWIRGDRNVAEYLWQFCKRLQERKQTNGKKSGGLAASLKSGAEWVHEGGNYEAG